MGPLLIVLISGVLQLLRFYTGDSVHYNRQTLFRQGGEKRRLGVRIRDYELFRGDERRYPIQDTVLG